jgi:mannitol/fructose-specific phosphotransferase system IIA component (Ntr-type)
MASRNLLSREQVMSTSILNNIVIHHDRVTIFYELSIAIGIRESSHYFDSLPYKKARINRHILISMCKVIFIVIFNEIKNNEYSKCRI